MRACFLHTRTLLESLPGCLPRLSHPAPDDDKPAEPTGVAPGSLQPIPPGPSLSLSGFIPLVSPSPRQPIPLNSPISPALSRFVASNSSESWPKLTISSPFSHFLHHNRATGSEFSFVPIPLAVSLLSQRLWKTRNSSACKSGTSRVLMQLAKVFLRPPRRIPTADLRSSHGDEVTCSANRASTPMGSMND